MIKLNENQDNIIPLLKVPVLQKITVLTVFFFFSAFHVGAEEIWRLRYSVPTSIEGEVTRGSSKASQRLNTSGHSVSMVFANGIGFGYSTVRTNGSLGEIDYKFKLSLIHI